MKHIFPLINFITICYQIQRQLLMQVCFSHLLVVTLPMNKRNQGYLCVRVWRLMKGLSDEIHLGLYVSS